MKEALYLNYNSLKKLYYLNQSDQDKFDSIVNSRKNNEETVYVGLKIHPFAKKLQERMSNKTFDIFYVPNREMQLLEEHIYSNSSLINRKLLDIPEAAIHQLFMNNLIDELQSTNDIEGVHSSKKELSDTINYINQNKNSKRRFKDLVTQYLNIPNDNYNRISSIEDFRVIWDRLVKEEIDEENFPDGKNFRKNIVQIENGSKVIHVGDYSEQQINNDLNMLIGEMNNEKLPYLARHFMAHFFYEYVHPFYDGNGRTGRFIICSYLSHKLDPFSAITFSSAIAENKNKYYHAFSEMEDDKNHGEATSFIMSMMDLLIFGQEKMIFNINEDKKQFDNAQKIIDQLNIGGTYVQISKGIMEILFQQYIFGTYLPPLTDTALAEFLGVTRYKLNKSLDYLEKRELIEQVGKAPKAHRIAKKMRQSLET